MQKVLWITGRLPFPLYSGDALFTAGLVKAARRAGMDVSVVGLTRGPAVAAGELNAIADADWHQVAAEPRPAWQSVLSPLPRDAFGLAPAGMRARVDALLSRTWDWIVLDHARSGGVLDLVLAKRKGARLAYLAHNVEGRVRLEVAGEMAEGFAKAPYLFDATKYRHLEARLLRAADRVLAITAEDVAEFRRSGVAAYHVAPVYFGPRVATRTIDAATPRRIMLIGSFDWVAKQKNLARFLERSGDRLARAGIALDIIGSVPGKLREMIGQRYGCVRLHGSVDDVRELAGNARCGVIPEELGGGMKLKTLDYIFMRVPVFSLDPGIAGLPDAVRGSVFSAPDFDVLCDGLAGRIDDFDLLNQMQDGAFTAAAAYFRVEDAAAALSAALAEALGGAQVRAGASSAA